jgi:PKD repeat protein
VSWGNVKSGIGEPVFQLCIIGFILFLFFLTGVAAGDGIIIETSVTSTSSDSVGDGQFHATSCRMRQIPYLGFGTILGGANDYRCYRSYLYFDTSSLGEGSIIYNATLSLYIDPINYNKTFDFTIVLQQGITEEYPHRPALDSDFNRIYYTGNGGSANTSLITGPGQYLTITLTDLSWINKNGWTKLCLRCQDDIMDRWRGPSSFAANAGSVSIISRRPTLYITYEDFGPIVNFSYTPTYPEEGKFIAFTDQSTDPNGYLVNWTWDFGDGTTSYQRNPHHSYQNFQTQTVTLMVEDNDGYINNHTQSIIMRNLYTNTTIMGNQTTIGLLDQAHLLLTLTTTQPTNVYTSVFSGNPTTTSHPEGINAVGHYFDVSIDDENIVEWPLNISLFYTQEDLDAAGLTEQQLAGIYYWNTSGGEWMLYAKTGVNTTNQKGYEGYCWAEATHLTYLTLGGDTLPPVVQEDHTPLQGTTDDNLVFNLTVTDNVCVTSSILWLNNQSYPMEHAGNDYTYALVVPSNSTEDIVYQCTFSDASHNTVITTPKHITITDDDPPSISMVHHTQTLENYTMYLNVSCVITDNIGVETVLVTLNGPQHSSSSTPLLSGNDTYWSNTSLSLPGIYTYTIIAIDGSGNENQTVPTNVTIELPNIPPGKPADPHPANGSTNMSLHTFLSWTCEDPNEDTLLFDVFFGNQSPPPQVAINHTQIFYDPGGLNASTKYFWQILAKDNNGDSTKGTLWQFTTGRTTENHPPDSPQLLEPQNGTITINTSPLLSVFVSDPDNDSLIIRFYNGAGHTLLGTNLVTCNGTTTFTWENLPSNTLHTWYVIVNDSLEEISSELWSFTTPQVDDQNETGDGNSDDDGGGTSDNDEGNPGGNTNGGGQDQPVSPGNTIGDEPLVPQNIPPIADAQVSDTQVFVGIELIFNASESYDPDGEITRWLWNFGDGTTGEGNILQHTYVNAGTYPVFLEVTDNGDASATDELTITVIKPNRPPAAPLIEGPLQANQHTFSRYTIVAGDPDGDPLVYIIDWGDNSNETITMEYPEDTPVNLSHNWTSPGFFTLHLKASDGYTESPTISVMITVDIHDLGDLGILIDSDSDGIYDLFSPQNRTYELPVIRDEQGIYHLDIDNDGTIDVLYDPETDHVYPYVGPEDTKESSEGKNPLFIAFVISGGILLFILVCAYLIIKRTRSSHLRPRKPQKTYRPLAPSKPRDLQLWGKRSTKLPKKIQRPRKTAIWKHRLKSFIHYKQRQSISRKKTPPRHIIPKINARRPKTMRKTSLPFSSRSTKSLLRTTTSSHLRPQKKESSSDIQELKANPWQKHSSWSYHKPSSRCTFFFRKTASPHAAFLRPKTKKIPSSTLLHSKKTGKKTKTFNISPARRHPKPHAFLGKKHKSPWLFDARRSTKPPAIKKLTRQSARRTRDSSPFIRSLPAKHQRDRHPFMNKGKRKDPTIQTKHSFRLSSVHSSKTLGTNRKKVLINNKQQPVGNLGYKPSARRRQGTLPSNEVNQDRR